MPWRHSVPDGAAEEPGGERSGLRERRGRTCRCVARIAPHWQMRRRHGPHCADMHGSSEEYRQDSSDAKAVLVWCLAMANYLSDRPPQPDCHASRMRRPRPPTATVPARQAHVIAPTGMRQRTADGQPGARAGVGPSRSAPVPEAICRAGSALLPAAPGLQFAVQVGGHCRKERQREHRVVAVWRIVRLFACVPRKPVGKVVHML